METINKKNTRAQDLKLCLKYHFQCAIISIMAKSKKQEEHLKKLADSMRGKKWDEIYKNPHPRKGVKHTEESKEKMRKSHKAHYQKGYIPWNTGKKMSEEYKEKLRNVDRTKTSGKNHYLWKGGSWIWWQKKIKERDNYTCQKCGLREPEIVEACHIKPIKGLTNRVKNGHELNNYENLVTLCPNDHKRFDKGLIKLKQEI